MHFSSNALPRRDRVAVWREVYGQMLRVDMEPLRDTPFHVDLKLRVWPGLSTVLGTVGGTRNHRTRSLISDGNNDVGLVMVLSGTGLATQHGREMVLREGEAVFFSCGDLGAMHRSLPVRNLGITVPRAALDALVPNVDDAIMRPIPRNSEALRLVKSYLGVLDNNNQELATPTLQHAIVSHFHDLAACVIGDIKGNDIPAASGGMRAARLNAIKADIAANAGQRDLTLDTIAARHNISPSYVRKLLEADSTTFTDAVLRERLARAYRLLTDPRKAGQPISELAFAAGFGDLSYFNRAFRRHFGYTPSEARSTTSPVS